MQYAIITDLNRCVGCLACSVACKSENNVPLGQFWNKVLRVGPFPTEEGGTFDKSAMYFLPVTCMHCENPECVTVCPTGASVKLDDGTVQIDAQQCIGCQACIPACPYGVRYLNEELTVVEKCTMCHDRLEKDELPQCVMQCCARARFFGDVDEGWESFRAPADPVKFYGQDCSYEHTQHTYVTIGDYCKDFTVDDVHFLSNENGNNPSCAFILRNREWKSEETAVTVTGGPKAEEVWA